MKARIYSGLFHFKMMRLIDVRYENIHLFSGLNLYMILNILNFEPLNVINQLW